jgi:hypothetical protein
MRPGTPSTDDLSKHSGSAVDHVDALEAADRADVDAVVVRNDEVRPFDQVDAHALGEVRMLEVRGIVDARREHHDPGEIDLARRERREHVEQLRGVVVDGQNRRVLENLGKHLLRDDPVLEHVRHAGRHAEVVLEHVDGAVGVAHEVGAADVRPYAVGRVRADAAFEEVRRRGDDILGHDAVGDNAPVVVKVVDEMIERREPLNETALDARPLGCFDRARDHVERPRPVDVLAFGVDGKRDPHLGDRAFGVALALGELALTERREIAREMRGRGPRLARRREELVEERARLVLSPVDLHAVLTQAYAERT